MLHEQKIINSDDYDTKHRHSQECPRRMLDFYNRASGHKPFSCVLRRIAGEDQKLWDTVAKAAEAVRSAKRRPTSDFAILLPKLPCVEESVEPLLSDPVPVPSQQLRTVAPASPGNHILLSVDSVVSQGLTAEAITDFLSLVSLDLENLGMIYVAKDVAQTQYLLVPFQRKDGSMAELERSEAPPPPHF